MDQLLNDFSPGLFIMQTVIMIVLIFLMVKFAWKPILNSLDEREEGIQGALDAAEKAKLEMQNLHADNEKLLQQARAERETMLRDARHIKENMISTAKEEAKNEADKMIIQAQEVIESEKRMAKIELKQYVADLSLDIAEKVIKHELSNKDKQMKLVEEMLVETKLN